MQYHGIFNMIFLLNFTYVYLDNYYTIVNKKKLFKNYKKTKKIKNLVIVKIYKIFCYV
jgi:hypothetical protein